VRTASAFVCSASHYTHPHSHASHPVPAGRCHLTPLSLSPLVDRRRLQVGELYFVPYFLTRGVAPLLLHDPILLDKLHRLGCPLYLAAHATARLAALLVRWLRHLHDTIRDEAFLVGVQLANSELHHGEDTLGNGGGGVDGGGGAGGGGGGGGAGGIGDDGESQLHQLVGLSCKRLQVLTLPALALGKGDNSA
jgi:hypothetical protein